ncbi:EAL domain-containing protein [Escherichia coli]|nr:EAL domain-containing protein [Escherichia coli]
MLELTEQRPFCITHRTERILCQLSDAGVEFALDDFGSGYSTLSYLKYFPVSYIKVDKTFIRDVLWEDTSRHIVECVISLAEKNRSPYGSRGGGNAGAGEMFAGPGNILFSGILLWQTSDTDSISQRGFL